MDWKTSFLESTLLGQNTDKQNPDKVLAKCIDLAYKDMMTAGRYYSNSFLHTKEQICNITKSTITKSYYVFSRTLISDISLLFSEKEIIGNGNKYVTRYGLSQKLINMTFKYLYIFSNLLFDDYNVPNFTLCDCPLDSIILSKACIKDCIWSKLTEKQYQLCQSKITDLLKGQSLDSELLKLGNLAFDFLNW